MKIYLISDCHGNINGLSRALEKKGIIDSAGNRQLARRHQVISVGDLANCVADSWIGDVECLSLVGEVIDDLIIGNHEMPYLADWNTFNGFSHRPEVMHHINRLMNADLIGGAVICDGILITHAGLSKSMLSIDMTAKEAFETIDDNFKNRNWNHSFFGSVGYARGGRNFCGGILWCDFEKEFVPTDFPQIVGHTPKYVRLKKNALCIDVGAKDQETEPFILEIS